MTPPFRSLLLLVCLCPFFSNSLERPTTVEMLVSQAETLRMLNNLTVRALKAPTTLSPESTTEHNFTTEVSMLNVTRITKLVLAVAVEVYMGCGQAVVCYAFLVPAVLVISDVLKLSQDVAGGTFLAFAVSTPLIFTNLMVLPDTVTLLSPWPNIHLPVAVVLCCFFRKRKPNVVVSWWTVGRSIITYLTLVLITFLCTLGGSIYWYQPSLLIACLFGYDLFMFIFNDRLRTRYFETDDFMNDDIVGEKTAIVVREHKTLATGPNEESPTLKRSSQTSPGHQCSGTETKQASPLPHSHHPSHTQTADHVGASEDHPPSRGSTHTAATEVVTSGHAHHVDTVITVIPIDEDPLSFRWPASPIFRAMYVFLIPLAIPLWLTLPDVRKKGKRKWFPIGYIGSIVWILGFQYVMLLVKVEGFQTFAAGALIGGAISAVRRGLGDMTISLIYGSSIFDLAIGYPVPCLVTCILRGRLPSAVHVTEAAFPVVVQAALYLFLCCARRKLIVGLGLLLSLVVTISLAGTFYIRHSAAK